MGHHPRPVEESAAAQVQGWVPTSAQRNSADSGLEIWDGFVCDLCEYIITSESRMHSRHWKVYKDVIDRKETLYQPVKAQVFIALSIQGRFVVMVPIYHRILLDCLFA